MPNIGQLITSYQAHGGSVNTSTTPKTQYDYADGSDNTIRPVSLTYPGGRHWTYDYADTIDGAASRIRAIRELSGLATPPVVQYEYLGLGTPVTVSYMQQVTGLPLPVDRIRYTLVGATLANDPDTGDIYKGLDRFGRVKDSRWRRRDGVTTNYEDIARIEYGYNRASSRIWRKDPVAQSYGKEYDELYTYDGLQRLKTMARGTLNGTQTALTSETFAQCWTLDATGNWRRFREDDDGDGTWDLEQQRLANAVNEITDISATVGQSWVTPDYDPAGNMTTIPQPKDPSKSYIATYDAWNRLTKLVQGPSVASSSSSTSTSSSSSAASSSSSSVSAG